VKWLWKDVTFLRPELRKTFARLDVGGNGVLDSVPDMMGSQDGGVA
jgi:hypothetical protein